MWWIASWADDDEQYKEEQPREGLLLAGAMNCWEEFSHLSLSLSLLWPTDPLVVWVAGPIYRGPGPLPKYRAGREPTTGGKFEGGQLVQAILTKGGLCLSKALVVTPSWAPR